MEEADICASISPIFWTGVNFYVVYMVFSMVYRHFPERKTNVTIFIAGTWEGGEDGDERGQNALGCLCITAPGSEWEHCDGQLLTCHTHLLSKER
jgi:hypothetical protein